MSEKYFLGAMTQNGFSTEFGKIMAFGFCKLDGKGCGTVALS